MENFLAQIENALSQQAYPTRPAGLYEPIAYALSGGGKRVRPHLTLLACSLYSDEPEKAIPAALSVETYHNHTLLHDDLMDGADLRRGRPTVFRKWDANTAILSGDTMLILAFNLLLEGGYPNAAELLQLLARTAREVCEGQQYDMNFEQRNDVTEVEYIEMIRLKTSVLLACALKMGALVAGAPADQADLLYRFGEQIGLAFQLQDDYLDCYGDPAVFGKQIGGDIASAKKTYLLINALESADEKQRADLNRLLSDEAMPRAEKLAAVIQIYNALDIPARCQARISAYYEAAREVFNQLNVDPERKQPLWDFAEKMLHRNK
ncbi:polyprenyl synthetase family protein [Alloprevotella tannerae]|uniref:polyprenyl synthetase family protein n=1 Tax=Alloprevotella tannerae TaxID=76122 RepID=UPI0028EBE103|nr:polyprenyl synthetase family protein [Alloprevotella tannerae]